MAVVECTSDTCQKFAAQNCSADVSREVRIEGLETRDYLDNLSQQERFTKQEDVITFESEVDGVYVGCPGLIAVIDHEKKRTFIVRKEGLPDIVVWKWNPWEKKSKTMTDFGDDEYKQMLCVDVAAVERVIFSRRGVDGEAGALRRGVDQLQRPLGSPGRL
ncbi:unnamed protein product [Miscanthus lutarioriparius]|uniref:Uncharacterized protein n=1 Tax=Miscanthus lutarioriparius TaxID=422564 RepID=A0A811QZ24_9POAL|nr:unnamed protein product [Miscanthus lutarioriparius]